MKWRLEIDTDNDAFVNSPSAEIARILRYAADNVDVMQDTGITEGEAKLTDANGNTVGSFDFVRAAAVDAGVRCQKCAAIQA
jgi:hypothetical protein